MLLAESLSRRGTREVCGHGGIEFPRLSMGTYCAGNRAVALREAAAGKLLAVHYYFWRGAGRRGVRGRGNDPRHGIVARGVSGIRETIADTSAGNTDSGQSFGGESGRIGRTLFRA